MFEDKRLYAKNEQRVEAQTQEGRYPQGSFREEYDKTREGASDEIAYLESELHILIRIHTYRIELIITYHKQHTKPALRYA